MLNKKSGIHHTGYEHAKMRVDLQMREVEKMAKRRKSDRKFTNAGCNKRR
jgi:alpha-mannosidase